MPHPRFIASLAVVALCWFAAGPGGAALQLSLACRMEQMHQSPHHQHHVPPGHSDGPCICDQMGGGVDMTVSPTLPAAVHVGPIVRRVTVEPKQTPRFPLPASRFPSPPTPPPIAG